MEIDLTTASVEDIKAAVKTLRAAANLAECRDNGHRTDHLHIVYAPETQVAPGLTLRGNPAGISCMCCGTTWAVTGSPVTYSLDAAWALVADKEPR